MDLSKEYKFKESEKKWQKFWQDGKIFVFKPKKGKFVYSVDTPPPTVSGDMHIGHAFSYSQQDFIVRYQRMKGMNVFYPFGTDDNGLPTEKLVEKLKNVRSVTMQRDEFVKLCNQTITEIKPAFIQSWKDIGMSCDFKNSYSTIDKHCIKTSQMSFLDLYKKGLLNQQESPTMWCVHCQTAIAQAELEDKELDSTFNDVAFSLENGDKIIIATTRPELIGACVCVYVHPHDQRYKGIIGQKIKVPLFNYLVPIFADESASMEKGSGVLMICSYGDKYDVEAIKKRGLQARVLINKDGRMNELAGKYKDLKIKEARKKILEDLEEECLLLDKKPINHNVNVHERCGTEIEFLTTKQWFIKIIENKEKLISEGAKIKWHPESMYTRYKHWIEGLQWDWCISRQRHFGVPFPVWYCKKCGSVIIASEDELPIDPLAKKPKEKCKCGSTSFEGEKDVMDTCATSSLSPEIVLNWVKDKYGYKSNIEMYPMSLRPQAHDIIRTWAFYTIVKGIYHFKNIPWENIMISGHVLDPKGESMHKSKGNVVNPKEVLDKYPVDALRFWAAGSKLGDDLRYLEKDLQTGAKTANKLWNASKFSLQHLEDFNVKKFKGKLELMDQWILAKLNNVIVESTSGFEDYEYSRAKSAVENFFWHDFCDNYLEIIKDRIYNSARSAEEKQSAQYTLYVSLLSILKLFAPIMPHITEEIYQMFYLGKEKEILDNSKNSRDAKDKSLSKSIHLSKWPVKFKVKNEKKLIELGDKFVEVLTLVRREKSKAAKSLKEPVKNLTCYKELEDVIEDLKAVTKAESILFANNVKVGL